MLKPVIFVDDAPSESWKSLPVAVSVGSALMVVGYQKPTVALVVEEAEPAAVIIAFAPKLAKPTPYRWHFCKVVPISSCAKSVATLPTSSWTKPI